MKSEGLCKVLEGQRSSPSIKLFSKMDITLEIFKLEI